MTVVTTDIARINLAFRVAKASKVELFGLRGENDWMNIFLTDNIITALENDENCGYTYLTEDQRDCLEQKVGVVRILCNQTTVPAIQTSCTNPIDYLVSAIARYGEAYESEEEAIIATLNIGLVFNPNDANICCPDCGLWVVSSVESFLKLAEGLALVDPEGGERNTDYDSCYFSNISSTETYLELYESCSEFYDITPKNPQTTLCGLDYLTDHDLLDVGMVELGTINGSTLVCKIMQTIIDGHSMLTEDILNAGIVVDCSGICGGSGSVSIMSIESYLKCGEAIG